MRFIGCRVGRIFFLKALLLLSGLSLQRFLRFDFGSGGPGAPQKDGPSAWLTSERPA